LVSFLLLRGTAESGALKANALPGGARRLAVRAVKGAQFAFIGAKRETLDRRSGRSRRRFSEGRANQSFKTGSKELMAARLKLPTLVRLTEFSPVRIICTMLPGNVSLFIVADMRRPMRCDLLLDALYPVRSGTNPST